MKDKKQELIIFISGNLDFDKISDTGIWELEERMNADHFEIHKSAGFRSGHIPLKIISKEEIEEINKLFD